MMGPVPPLSAGDRKALYERRRNGEREPTYGGGVASVLEEMSNSIDHAECYLMFCALIAAVSLSFTIVFSILIAFAPRSHPIWYWLAGGSGLISVMSFVLIIEPRPMHWLPSLESILRSMGRLSPTEIKLRVRRWWQWRKRYATKTKLNV